jgi:signal peptidase II
VVLGLLLGGAIGNLIDRLVRSPGLLRGHVIDWIRVPHFAVFNLADSAITIGGFLAVLLALLGRQLDGTVVPAGRHQAPRAADPGAGDPGTADPAADPGGADAGVEGMTTRTSSWSTSRSALRRIRVPGGADRR